MVFEFCFKILNMLGIITPSGGATDGNDVVDPLYNALGIIMPVALGIILLSGTLYAVAIGVQYSRAEEAKDRAAAKKKLINGIIGFGLVLVLIAILYAVRGPVVDLINS